MSFTPNNSQRMGFDTERSVIAPFTGLAQKIGSPLEENPVTIIFDNQSDVDVVVGDSPTKQWKTFVAGEVFVLDCRANHGIAANWTVDLGTQFYATGTGGTGAFRIAINYAR